MQFLALAALAVLPVLVIVAGLKDLTSMTIPNRLTVALALAYVPAALLVGVPPTEMAVNLGVGLACLVLGMVLFALRVFGGGDAKLMAAVCLWLGLAGVTPFIFWTALAGGLFGVSLLIARARLAVYAPMAPTWVSNLLNPKGDIPYGVAIAVGALVAYPHSRLITLFVGTP